MARGATAPFEGAIPETVRRDAPARRQRAPRLPRLTRWATPPRFTWLSVSDSLGGIAGYRLIVSTDAAGNNVLFNALVGNVTSYTISNAAPGETLYARVDAVNNAGVEGPASSASVGTPGARSQRRRRWGWHEQRGRGCGRHQSARCHFRTAHHECGSRSRKQCDAGHVEQRGRQTITGGGGQCSRPRRLHGGFQCADRHRHRDELYRYLFRRSEILQDQGRPIKNTSISHGPQRGSRFACAPAALLRG